MRFTNNLSRMARVLGATVLTAAAALTLTAAPAEAKPPSHAPAHGYRAKHQDNHRNHRDRHDRYDRHDHDRHDRNRRYDYRSNDRNRYSRYDRDNRTWLDWDRDGIPNSRDRHPRDSRRH